MPSPDSPPRPEGPSRPARPAAGEVHVWVADLDAGGETAPAARLAAARRGLREVLSRYLGEDPDAIELAHREHGKPALADPRARLDFNLSHSGGLALVAIAGEGPVGVDVERVGRRRDFVRLAAREFGGEAAAELEAAAPERRAATFYAAWTRHEARLKCHGGGLGGPPPSGPIAVTDLDVGNGYAAAVAVPGDAPAAVRLYRLDLR